MTDRTIRTIHVACRVLGIDEDTRKTMQLELVGKASLSDMSDAEHQQVLDALSARGFRPSARGKGRFRQASRGDVRLIFVLWRALGDAGVLKDPSARGLHAFVRNRFEGSWGSVPIDINTMRDRAQIDAVLNALKQWLKREKIDFDWERIKG
ncbi:gp16 family protein [Sagittula salina]|uniref:Regulatory protein GemA n=1 Tax=Sagittula salina TaxID=2820268 RepID=A0A940S1B3_9RHOB|nr:regulatory protein GemA [Sagittula salina]MBP0483963.1 regulatory protein GemA [Sagittula salina]